MGIFQPPPHIQIGGAQPSAPAVKLVQPFVNFAVNDPPYQHEGRRIAQQANIISQWQPDPWTFSYAGPVGGAEPYAARLLNPSIAAVEVDNPPFQHPERSVWAAELKTIWQPDPWTYSYKSAQPYDFRVYSPGIPGQSTDNPPFVHRARTVGVLAGLITTWQPDPWTFGYLGPAAGLQPYAARLLPAALLNVVVNTIPYTQAGRTAQQANIISQWQPDPWTYSYSGGPQPFAPRELARNFVPYSFGTIIG